jgi:hypothetical protein
MLNKQNIRKSLKAIEKLSEEMENGMNMDFAMDGSGECGRIIIQGRINWFNRELQKILTDNNLTFNEVEKITNEWAKRELEMGPKQIFISMYSRRKGIYKEIDYLDTKWGNLSFTLHNFKLQNC